MALEEERNKRTEAREVTGPGHPRVQTPPFIFFKRAILPVSYQLCSEANAAAESFQPTTPL